MQKMGWFGVVRRHSRSTAMSPFDIFGIRKLESLDYNRLCDPTFSRFSRTPTCDRHRHRHRHTDGHRPMASTADA